MSNNRNTNSKIEAYGDKDDTYYTNLLLDTKVKDLCLSTKTLKVLKDAEVITLRDLINVDHSKVQWGKVSISEVYDLLESLNLSFVNSPYKNKFLSHVAQLNAECAATLPWIDLTDKWEEAEEDFIAHPEKYDDITLLGDDENPYVIVKGEKFYMPKDSWDVFPSKECTLKAEDFDAEGILTLIGIKKFVRKR